MTARAIALWFVAAALARGQFSTPLASGESEAAQLGSVSRTMGAARASDLGVLRCPAPLALVGLRMSRGEALSAVQLICAPVQCSGATCGWRQSQFGPSAGAPQSGDASIQELCGANGVVTGFRGYGSGPYARDLRVECGLIGGLAQPSGGKTAVPLSGAQRAFAGRSGPAPDGSGPMNGSCGASAASALSYALAPLRGSSGRVVQAVSLYCAAARAVPPPVDPPARKPDGGTRKQDAGIKKSGRSEAGTK